MAEQPNPRIEIISTGTEILQGLYPDTNAQWLSRQLAALGLTVAGHAAVGDSLEDLARLLDGVSRRCDLVIISGGLGPTVDDVNRYAIARTYGCELVEDDAAVQQIRDRFARRGLPFVESNRVQALVPRGARVLYNEWGTAPGFILEDCEGRATLIALPGPPRELQPMFDRWVRPWLLERYKPDTQLATLTLHTMDLPESQINAAIADLFHADPDVYVGLLAAGGKVDIRLTARGRDGMTIERKLGDFRRRIETRIGAESIYGCDDATLESVVADLLRTHNLHIAVAESCTGGMIASRLTNVAGASSFLLEGFVTYSNESKTARLGVDPDLIAQHGAVSRPVARAMAEGVLRVSGADLGLAVTGIAGPTGGTPEKPVGLVFVGLAWGNDSTVIERRFLGNRNENRAYSTNVALDLVRRYLLHRGGKSQDCQSG
ncbi:MAG: competence/damage-inducible protein A [Candidatus Sumerlaeia bacterium]|nr:competence/damage-inducible protein A [Candidatus Sumerlaeia bacterium]